MPMASLLLISAMTGGKSTVVGITKWAPAWVEHIVIIIKNDIKIIMVKSANNNIMVRAMSLSSVSSSWSRALSTSSEASA